jgi:hypothetical protein
MGAGWAECKGGLAESQGPGKREMVESPNRETVERWIRGRVEIGNWGGRTVNPER